MPLSLKPIEEKPRALFVGGGPFTSHARPHGSRGLPPALKMTKQFCERHGIKDAVRRHAAFAGHFDTPVHVVELPDGVGVGINAEDAAVIQSLLMPAPVEIEPPRMGIDFNRNAVLSAGSQNLVDVDLISRAALELSSGHVAENGRVGILDRRKDTLGLFLFGHFEAAVNAGDDKIKVAQHAVGIVERTVSKNIRFDPFQNAKGLAVAFIEPIGLAVLLGDFVKRQAARIVGGLRMVRDAEIFEAPFTRGFRHCL